MKKYLSLVLLCLLLIPVLPISAQEAAFTPTFEPNPCPMPVPAGYVDGESILCGTVAVPEFHSDPAGDTIRLSVTVLKSEGAAPDPLVMFQGGPGADILGFLPVMSSESAAPITQDRDVVLMSERGTAGADPVLYCPELDAARAGMFGAPLDEINASQLTAYAACRERLIAEGVDLNAYNNPERAADVPLVMQALGYEEYNVWGVSGGGIMAQYVLREHPAGVRTIMTDSGAFPTAYIGTVFYNIYEVVSNAYRRMFEACTADAVCNETYPDLENVYWTMIDQLNAKPAPVEIINPATGEAVAWELDGDTIVSILGNQFSNVEIMPRVIYELASGDYSFVLERVPSLYASESSYADALFESVVCSEISGLTQETAAKDNAYPQVITALEETVQMKIDLCGFWGVNPIAEGEALISDVPILIMEGTFDSNKQPELGAVVAENFSTSYLVEFANAAHGVFGTCALRLMADFMNDPTASPDTACVPTAVTFAMPGSELTFSPRTFDALGLETIVPDGWAEIDAGVFVNPIDESVLVITSLPGEDIEAGITTFAQIAGLSTPEKIGDLPIGAATWSVYQVIDGDTGTMVGATAHNGSIYFAGIQTKAADLETATDTVLRPVVEALTFTE